MAIKVIPLRLESDDPFELALIKRYEELPRSRRVQWIRQVIRLGSAAYDNGATHVAQSSSPMATTTSTRPSHEDMHPPTPTVATEAANDLPVAKEPAAHALSGFFG